MPGQPAKSKSQTAKQRAVQARREKLERIRREEERSRRRRLAFVGGGTVVLLAAIVAGIVAIWPSNSSTAKTAIANADTSTSLLAPAAAVTGSTIDGVSANNMEQLAYHIHAHLAIYINGTQKIIPYGIGIEAPLDVQQTSGGAFAGGAGYYYLHTHDETGVIHIESPTTTTYTLGQFFDIWGQKLSDTQVGSSSGHVTTYVDGKLFTGDPTTITLTPHKVIQLDVGKVVAPVSFTFPQGL